MLPQNPSGTPQTTPVPLTLFLGHPKTPQDPPKPPRQSLNSPSGTPHPRETRDWCVLFRGVPVWGEGGVAVGGVGRHWEELEGYQSGLGGGSQRDFWGGGCLALFLWSPPGSHSGGLLAAAGAAGARRLWGGSGARVPSDPPKPPGPPRPPRGAARGHHRLLLLSPHRRRSLGGRPAGDPRQFRGAPAPPRPPLTPPHPPRTPPGTPPGPLTSSPP